MTEPVGRAVVQERPERWRLFFALWPEEGVSRHLASLGRHLASAYAGRLLPVENLHLTLAFLGSVDAAGRACAEQAAAQVNAGRFELVLDQVGWWRRPQVLWVGTDVVPEALLELVAGLRRRLQGCPVQRDDRPYQVHLTLMRKVRHGPVPYSIEPLHWPVKRFALVSSDTLPGGSEYTVLRSWDLC